MPRVVQTTADRWLFSLAYLAFTVPLGLFLAVVTPLGGVADEPAHAIRAESLASGEVFGHRGPQLLPSGATQTSAGVDVDLGFPMVLEVSYQSTHFGATELRRAHDAKWTHVRTYVQITPIAVYFPIFYVPAAAGIIGAKLAGAGPFDAFLAARLMNLAAFAVIGLTALLLARRGPGLLFCVLSVPMTVSLAASLNPDGLLIAASVLFVALLTRTEAEPTEPLGRARVVAGILIGLICLAKVPYAALAVLLLHPAQSFDRTLLRRLGLAGLVVLPSVLWIAYAMIRISSPIGPMPEYTPGPLWPGPHGMMFHAANAASQLRVLEANPLRVVSITWNTIMSDPWIVRSSFGILGFLSLLLPGWLYVLWMIAAPAALAGDVVGGKGRWRVRFDWANCLIAALTLFLGLIAIYMSQYLVWTQVGAEHVLGPTGRYLLPLIPGVALAIPTLCGPWLHGLRIILYAAACVAAFAGLVAVPHVIISGFYLQ